jgi:WD40 repeat protein
MPKHKNGSDSLTDKQRRGALSAFRRALGRESHVLQQEPDLLWQQLHNRLQWEGNAVKKHLTLERERRSGPSTPSWIWIRTPFREAKALLRTLPQARDRVFAVSPDGRWLASGGGSIRLWDIHTGVQIAKSDDGEDRIVSCAFDCNGDSLITGNTSGEVHIRDAQTLTKLGELRCDGGGAHCATSPVQPLAAIVAGTTLRLIELPSGSELGISSVESGAFSCCAFSNGGHYLATGDDDGTVRWWSVDPLEEVAVLVSDQAGTAGGIKIKACAVSPNLAFVAVVFANWDSVLLVGSPDKMGKPQTMTLHLFESVNDCCISPDGRWLTCVSNDHLTWLWELKDLKSPVSVLEGHTAPVVSCTFAANGSVLATASEDGTVKLWDPWLGKSQGGIVGHHDRVTGLAFAPDGSFVVSASADMTLKTWEPAPTAERRTLEGHGAEVWDCTVLKGGNLIASAGGDGTIRFWDSESGEQTQVLEIGVGHSANLHALAFSPDCSLLASGCGALLSLWEPTTGKRIIEADLRTAGYQGADPQVQDCSFTLDGKRLLVACHDATLRLWDIAAWSEVRVLRGHVSGVSCCTIVPRSSFAVSGSEDGTLRLWNLDTGAEQHIFTGHTDQVWDCAVNSDGTVLVSVAYDGTLRVWDLVSRTPIGKFSVATRLRSVALHPAELRVAIGDYQGWVRVLDMIGSPNGAFQGGDINAI